jgi:hypothetical protein
MRFPVWILFSAFAATPTLAQYGPTEVPQPEAGVRASRQLAREVTGTVREVDHARGRVVLDADGDVFRLHFPPTALAGIQRGQRVTARVALEGASSTSSEGAGSFGTDAETGSPPARPPGSR